MYNYQNITKDMFFLEDLVKTEAPSEKYQLKNISGNFTKYKISDIQNFMLTGTIEDNLQKDQTFTIQDKPSFSAGNYQLESNLYFFGYSLEFFDRVVDNEYFIVPSIEDAKFNLKNVSDKKASLIGPMSSQKKSRMKKSSALDLLCNNITEEEKCVLPCFWDEKVSFNSCKPVSKTNLLINPKMKKVRRVEEMLKYFLTQNNQKDYKNLSKDKKLELKRELFDSIWKHFFKDDKKAMKIEDFNHRVLTLVEKAKEKNKELSRNWWTNTLSTVSELTTTAVAFLVPFYMEAYNQDVNALVPNMNNNTNMTVCTENAIVGEYNFLKSGSLGYTYYNLTNRNICEYLTNTSAVREHFEKDMKEIEEDIREKKNVCNYFDRDEIATKYFTRSREEGRIYYEKTYGDPCHINSYNGTKSLQVNESNLDIEFNNEPVTNFGENYSFPLESNNTEKMEYLISKTDEIGEEIYKSIQRMPYDIEKHKASVNEIIQEEYNTLWWEDMEPIEEVGKWKATRNESNDVIFEYNKQPNTSNVSNVSNVVYNEQWEFTLEELYEKLINLVRKEERGTFKEVDRDTALMKFPTYINPSKFFRIVYNFIKYNRGAEKSKFLKYISNLEVLTLVAKSVFSPDLFHF